MTEHADQGRAERSNLRTRFQTRLSRYRRLLLRRWWVPVLCAGLGIVVQGLRSQFESPTFTSVGRMIVSIKLNITEGSVYTEELSNFLGTQASLMQSGVVINRAHARVTAQTPELKAQAVSLNVTVLPKTTIFVLQATGKSEKYTQAFLQACMEEYIALKKDMRTQTSDTTVAGLTEQVMRLEKDLRQAEAELLAFQSTNSVVFSQDQGNNSAANYLAALNQRLAGQKSEYELLQSLTVDQNLERQQATGGTMSVADSSTDRSPGTVIERADTEYLRAKQQLLLLRAEQEEMGQYLRTNHPKMIAMSEDIARREQLLKIYRMQGAEQLENRKAALALEIKGLERDIKEWDAKMLDIQVKSADYQRLKGNVQRTQALYDHLLSTMQTLDVNKEIGPESVTIMEAASPAYPSQSDRSQRMKLGGLAGLGLGVLLLLFLDRLDDRMLSSTELKEAFDEELVGHIPRVKSLGRNRLVPLVTPEDNRHGFVEAYRNLRSSLLYMAQTEARPKVVLVTSSVPDEGKSLTAANLAITMAGAGSRVLLINMDLRKGALHERFQVPAKPGLTEVLREGLDWEPVVRTTKTPNLFLMPLGSFAPNAGELFLSERTKSLLRAGAAKYDYVFLDTSPVMAADDVNSLAPHVDGVLFVIRAEFTSAHVARAALDSLYQRQVRVLGLVFNSARPSFEGYYYYYYRYRGYYRNHPEPGRAASASGAGRESEGRVES